MKTRRRLPEGLSAAAGGGAAVEFEKGVRMKAQTLVKPLLVGLLLAGCRQAEEDPRIDAMRATVAEMESRQAEIGSRVESLVGMVEEMKAADRATLKAVQDLKASIEADRAAETEREQRRGLHEQLDRKMHLAESLRRHGQYTAAYKALKELAEAHPNSPQGHRARIELAELGITPEDMRKADEDVGKLLEANAGRNQAARRLMEEARSLEQGGDMPGAIKTFLKLSKEHPDSDGGRWVKEVLAQCGLTETSLELLPAEERSKAIRRFAMRRKIDSAHRGHEHPNLATASALSDIIAEAPDEPEVERARQYFYHHGIVSGRDELDALTPDQFRDTIGARIERMRKAQGQVHRARALLEQEQYADAIVVFQEVVNEFDDVPARREARENLRELGMVDIAVTDANRNEINEQVGETVWRRRQWERAEHLGRGGQYFEAAKILQHFRTELPASREALEAEKILGRWNIWNVKLDEAARDEVNEAAAAGEAAGRAFRRAEMMHHAGRIGDALRALLELARTHRESQVGREAEERLLHHGIDADAAAITEEDVAAATRRHEAREEHGRAHGMMRGGRYLEAIAVFREVAKDYAGIPEGHEAERILQRCGAWDVEITEQNQEMIVAALREMMNR